MKIRVMEILGEVITNHFIDTQTACELAEIDLDWYDINTLYVDYSCYNVEDIGAYEPNEVSLHAFYGLNPNRQETSHR